MPINPTKVSEATNRSDWWDHLPKSWEAVELRRVAEITASNVDKVAVEDEIPVRLCNYTDVYYNDYIEPDLDFMEASATQREIARFRLRGGEVLLTKDSETPQDIAIPAYVRPGLANVVCGYHLYVLRPVPGRLDGRFLLRACSVAPIRDQFVIAANGITRYGLGQEDLGCARIPVPPLESQHAIANFLDRETAKIDALIDKKQRLIELLQEKRAALITRAVTKGLDPGVEMKDSGVEWLRQIPAQWQAVQLKRFWTVLDCKHRTVSFVDSGLPVASIGEVADLDVCLSRAKRTTRREYEAMIAGGRKPERGDIIYSRNATVGAASYVSTDDEFCLGQDVCLIRSKEQSQRFLVHQLRSPVVQEQLEELMVGATFRRINVGQIKNIMVALPPLNEQVAVASYCDYVHSSLSSLANKVKEACVGLQEYRTSLISAAVTGKIDVRETIA